MKSRDDPTVHHSGNMRLSLLFCEIRAGLCKWKRFWLQTIIHKLVIYIDIILGWLKSKSILFYYSNKWKNNIVSFFSLIFISSDITYLMPILSRLMHLRKKSIFNKYFPTVFLKLQNLNLWFFYILVRLSTTTTTATKNTPNLLQNFKIIIRSIFKF